MRIRIRQATKLQQYMCACMCHVLMCSEASQSFTIPTNLYIYIMCATTQRFHKASTSTTAWDTAGMVSVSSQHCNLWLVTPQSISGRDQYETREDMAPWHTKVPPNASVNTPSGKDSEPQQSHSQQILCVIDIATFMWYCEWSNRIRADMFNIRTSVGAALNRGLAFAMFPCTIHPGNNRMSGMPSL